MLRGEAKKKKYLQLIEKNDNPQGPVSLRKAKKGKKRDVALSRTMKKRAPYPYSRKDVGSRQEDVYEKNPDETRRHPQEKALHCIFTQEKDERGLVTRSGDAFSTRKKGLHLSISGEGEV